MDVLVHGRSCLSDMLVHDVVVDVLVPRRRSGRAGARTVVSERRVGQDVVVDVLVHGRSCLSDMLVHNVVVDVLVHRRLWLSDALVEEKTKDDVRAATLTARCDDVV